MQQSSKERVWDSALLVLGVPGGPLYRATNKDKFRFVTSGNPMFKVVSIDYRQRYCSYALGAWKVMEIELELHNLSEVPEAYREP